MGQELKVQTTRSLDAVLAEFEAAGTPCPIVMVDGTLVMPSRSVPETWGEVRIKTPVGMVTLRRRGGEVAIVVFGNAGPELQGMQERLASAFAREV